MTGHEFASNLYHKNKEKSKFSTKYCGPAYQGIQYLDILKKPRILPSGQTREGSPGPPHPRRVLWTIKQIRLFQYGGKGGRKNSDTVHSSPLG